MSTTVHSGICWSPSELPNAKVGRRPMKRLMPTGLPGPSSTNSTFASFKSEGLPPAPNLDLRDAGAFNASSSAVRLRQLLHDLIDTEARRPLSRREVLERFDELL